MGINSNPDLLLVLTVWLARSFSPLRAVSWGLSLGLLKDILSVRLFGFNSFVFAVDALAVSFVCRRFYQESLWFGLALLSSAVIFNYLLLGLISGRFYLRMAFAEAVLDCILFLLLRRIHNAYK